jgi:uncharacterized membrane protein
MPAVKMMLFIKRLIGRKQLSPAPRAAVYSNQEELYMKKRLLFVSGIMAFLFLAGSLAFAQAASKTPSSDQVLGLIRTEQKLGPTDNIDPAKVSDKLLEQLGDAVMGERIGDERQHAWMENMMGGEGSATLANMHRLMGYRFLQGARDDMMPYGGMMGQNGASGRRDYRGGMMGGDGRSYGMMGRGGRFGMVPIAGRLPIWIIGGIVIAGAIAAVLFFTLRRKTETPLDILKKRLAKGDVTRDEYDKLKAELK